MKRRGKGAVGGGKRKKGGEAEVERPVGPTMESWWRVLPACVVLKILEAVPLNKRKIKSQHTFAQLCKDANQLIDQAYYKPAVVAICPSVPPHIFGGKTT
eukprot:TRINITY_DN3699_c0_g1_i1.p3 TRINITY_DN3699_c0_g1~~TRINITY_DN3699_c0_g1_i1.p3  ORF type:complete len:100 (+),score=20.83 TRINITY_DN3699_c0_g1_i1:67-366(+)